MGSETDASLPSSPAPQRTFGLAILTWPYQLGWFVIPRAGKEVRMIIKAGAGRREAAAERYRLLAGHSRTCWIGIVPRICGPGHAQHGNYALDMIRGGVGGGSMPILPRSLYR